jgi:hypothetical protein
MGLPMHGLQAEGMSFLFRNLSEKMEIVAYGNLGFGNIGFEIFGILRTILITSITTQRNMVIVNDPLIGLIQQYTSTLKWVITTKIGGKSSQTTSRTSILNNTVVREAVRVLIAWTTIAHPPIEILANLQPTEDRATYHGTMDHPDNATVRSAVGFVGDACWLIEGG